MAIRFTSLARSPLIQRLASSLVQLRGVLPAVFRPLIWLARMNGKQTAGLFLIFLLLLPAVPVRALDPGPQAPTSTGGQVPTAANAAIAGNTGAFTTGVEISLPPGRLGNVPQLSLGYSSGSGNGPFGVGWGVPMSNIVRLGSLKGVPGTTVNFTTDEFYLNLNGSSSRLLWVDMPGIADGVENCAATSSLEGSPLTYCTRRYHTEIETWMKVEAYYGRIPKPSPSTEFTADPANLKFWVITSKTGSEMIMGTNANARTPNFAWYLVKSIDVHKNTILYEYSKGKQSDGYFYYKKISYTGSDDPSKPLSPNYFVAFDLESRPDFNVSYRSGFRQIMGDRYNVIVVSTDPNIDLDIGNYPNIPSLVSYTMEYVPSFKTGRSLLKTVHHFGLRTSSGGKNATERPATVYHYRGQDSQPQGWTTNQTNIAKFEQGNGFSNSDGSTHDWGARLVDLEGDGLPDKIDYLKDDHTEPPKKITSGFLHNHKGDGFDGFDNTYLVSETDSLIPGMPFTLKGESNTTEIFDLGARLFDINHDNYADKIDYGGFITGGVGTNMLYLGNGNGFETTPAAFYNTLTPYPVNATLLPITGISPTVTAIPINDSLVANTQCQQLQKHCQLKSIVNIISGPGISSSSISPLATVIYQWNGLGIEDNSSGIYFNYDLFRTDAGGTITDPAPVISARQATLPLAVLENLADGYYQFKVQVHHSGQTPGMTTQKFQVSQDGPQVIPSASFTAFPLEGAAQGLEFHWAVNESPSSLTAAGLQLPITYNIAIDGGAYLGYSSSTQAILPISEGFSTIWLKAKDASGRESIPVKWNYYLNNNPIPTDINSFAEYYKGNQAGAVGTTLDRGTRVADLNGDGLPDLITSEQRDYVPYFKIAVWIQLPTGGFTNKTSQWNPLSKPLSHLRGRFDRNENNVYSSTEGYDLSDINGDGLPDLILSQCLGTSCSPNYNAIYLNNGHGFNSSSAGEQLVTGYQANPWLQTVSGCEFCQGGGISNSFNSISNTLTMYVKQGGVNNYANYVQQNSNGILQPRGNRYMDVNGDGLPDVVVSFTNKFGTNFRAVHINTGSGFINATQSYNVTKNNVPGPFTYFRNNDDVAQDQGIQCDNIKGTGMLDCLYYQFGGTPNSIVLYINQDKVPDLMDRIDNGYGGFSTISYLPSTNYLEAKTAINPPLYGGYATTTSMPFTLQLVDTITTCDGHVSITPPSGQCYTTRYQYAGGLYDRIRHEFRGYRVVRVWEGTTDPNTSPAYVDTYYRQDWPFAGMVDVVDACAVNASRNTCDQLLTRSFMNYVKVELPSRSINPVTNRPLFRELVEKDYDRKQSYDRPLPNPGDLQTGNYSVQTTVANGYAYDAFGNAVAMNSVGLVNNSDYNDITTTDNLATVTQYIVQGDEPGMTPGPWRVGMVRSAQSYQQLPASYAEPAFPPAGGSGMLSATRYCYDGSGASCTYSGTIGIGNITHASLWLDRADVDSNGNPRPGNRWLTSNTQYNEYGQIAALTDYAGNTTQYSYEAGNHSLLDRITDAQGNFSSYQYNAVGQIQVGVDLNSVETIYDYDSLWRLEKVFKPIMDPLNPAEKYRYALTATTANINSQHTETCKLQDWGVANYICSASYFDGMMRSYASVLPAPDPTAYDSQSMGVWTLTFWDDRGMTRDVYRPFKSFFPFRSADSVRDAYAAPTAVPANQPKSHYDYDEKKRITVTLFPNGTRSLTSESGLVTMAVDGKNHWVKHEKDGAGRLIKVYENSAAGTLNPNDNYLTQYSYDALGRLTNVYDPGVNNIVTNITYDSLGRKLSITDRDTGLTTYDYDDQSRLVRSVDSRCVATMMSYDTLSRVTGKTYSKNNRTDCATQPTPENMLKPVSFEYGTNQSLYNVGRLLAKSDSSGKESFIYNPIGEALTATRNIDVNGIERNFTVARAYTAQGLVKTLTYPDNYVVTNHYADNNTLVEVTGQIGTGHAPQTIYATYDQFNDVGQFTQGTVMGGQVQRNFIYDITTGRALRQTDQRIIGTAATLQQLDYANLALCITNSDGAICPSAAIFFDEVGNLSQVNATVNGQSRNQSFSYDGLNRLTTAQGNYGTAQYQYNSLGNLTLKDGKTYTYGAGGSHSVLSRTGGDTFGYDVAGNMTTSPGTFLKWDAEGRPDHVAHTKDSVTRQYDYTYDDGGSRVIKQVTDPVASKSYTRVYLGNLYEVQIEGAVGSEYITHTKHIFTGSSRIATITNTASGVDFAAMLDRQYHEQQLLALTALHGYGQKVGGSDWTAANALRIYHQGALDYQRHEAAINTAALLALSLFLLAGAVLYLRRAAREFAGVVAARRRWTMHWLPKWAYAPISYASLVTLILQIILSTGISVPSRAQEAFFDVPSTPAGLPLGISYYLQNHLASSTMILDDQANVLETHSYKPYGELVIDGQTQSHRFYFTGQEKEEFDLYQFGARWYSPDLGRFISADSIVPDPKDSQQFNRYTYANNNPINMVDPTGHFAWAAVVVGAIVGAISSYASGQRGWGVVLGAVLGAVQGGIGAEAYAGAIAAGGSAASAGLTAGYGTATFSALVAAVSGQNAGQAFLMSFAASAAGAGMGAAFQGATPAVQRTAAVLGSLAIAGTSASVSGGNVGVAIGVAFAGGMLNKAGDAVENSITQKMQEKERGTQFSFSEFDQQEPALALPISTRPGLSPVAPVEDDQGNLVSGASGKIAVMPMGWKIQNFAFYGSLRGSISSISVYQGLFNFQQGGKWDIQRIEGTGVDKRFIDAASIAIGVYAAAGGIHFNSLMSIQDLYASRHSNFGSARMDPTYTHLAERNVINTAIGYYLVATGAVRVPPPPPVRTPF